MTPETAEHVTWWSEEATAALTARNEWIRKAREEGASLRQIAELAHLSHSAVAKICTP